MPRLLVDPERSIHANGIEPCCETFGDSMKPAMPLITGPGTQAAVTVPTLVVQGRADPSCPSHASSRPRQPSPGPNRLLLGRRGHALAIGLWSEVAEAISGFARRRSVGRPVPGAAVSATRSSNGWLLKGLRGIAFVTFAWCASAHAAEPTPSDAVRALLRFQQDAWNRADIDAFMTGYWHDDSIRFAGGDAFRYGWQATIERYRKTYPDAATMGKLDFDLLEVRELSPAAVYVFGKWHLTRAQDPAGKAPHGLFTLIVEKKDNAWVITRDHTSAAAE